MPLENIVVRGAREHNLKNVNVTIPRDKPRSHNRRLRAPAKARSPSTPSTPKGSAATSSPCPAYARQFLGRMDKPDVEYIEGLSPAISIDQKGVSHNPRSTVGTVTEIYDYLRLLFARVGRPHCYKCGPPRRAPDRPADCGRPNGPSRQNAPPDTRAHGPAAQGRA